MNSSALFFCLYTFVAVSATIALQDSQQIQDSIQAFERQTPQITLEHRLLITAIRRRLGVASTPQITFTVPPTHSTPDERATRLHKLRQRSQMSKQEAEDLLAACTDKREVSVHKWKELELPTSDLGKDTVGRFAWRLLSQFPNMSKEALSAITQSLNDSNPLVCAAAALLLRNNKKLPPDIRREAGQKVIEILNDEELSCRPLNLPDYSIQRLDEVLFETLKVLAE